MTAQSIFSHRVSIVTGHYGTGKTELAVNLALALAAEGRRVMLADLDIVNPYFRSRERRPQLEAAGIQVICSSQACSDADVPALPAELLSILETGTCGACWTSAATRWAPGCWPGSAQDRPGGLPADLCAQRQPAGGPRAGGRRQLSPVHRGHHRPDLHRHREQHPPVRGDHPRSDPQGRRPGGRGLPPDGDPRPLPHGGAPVPARCVRPGEPVFPITINMKKPWER